MTPPERITPSPIPFGEALRFWFKLGFISFGGPAGQIAIMHQDLVEKKRWISEQRFLHALNYCMVLPGPEAQQLATYIGWLMHRTWGGIVAGTLFVLPSVFILIALSWIYVTYGNVPVVAGIFYGIKPAVVAIVLAAAWRIAQRALGHPARAAIVRLLSERGECVCGQIVDVMPLAQATVSQHLKVLKLAGLIRGQIDPPRVCYCINPEAVKKLKLLLSEL